MLKNYCVSINIDFKDGEVLLQNRIEAKKPI